MEKRSVEPPGDCVKSFPEGLLCSNVNALFRRRKQLGASQINPRQTKNYHLEGVEYK